MQGVLSSVIDDEIIESNIGQNFDCHYGMLHAIKSALNQEVTFLNEFGVAARI